MKLGQKVRDKVSGFTGVATGRAEFLYTTPTVQVSPQGLDSNGLPVTARWIEESQLEPSSADRLMGYAREEP